MKVYELELDENEKEELRGVKLEACQGSTQNIFVMVNIDEEKLRRFVELLGKQATKQREIYERLKGGMRR